MLELLAVLLIFAVLLGIVLFPAARWHRQQRIRSAVAVVRSAVQLAREQAMTRRETVHVAFVNQTDPGNVLRGYYCIHGTSDLSASNALPDGLSFFTNVICATSYEAATNQFDSPGGYVVLISDNHWAVISNQEYRMAFDPAGRVCELRYVGIVESVSPRDSLALTGLVTVAGSTGYITTDPRAP